VTQNNDLKISGPSIRVEVFRHDEKDKSEIDTKAQMTAKGRASSVLAGKSRQPKLNMGYVVASPRERAMHAALLQFFGPQFEDLNLHEHHYSDSMSKLADHLQKNHNLDLKEKFSTDERLNFDADSHLEFNKSFYYQYNKAENNCTLLWQLHESDQEVLQIARKTAYLDGMADGVRKIKGYTRLYGDLAEVIFEYFDKLEVWTEAYNKSKRSFDDDQMQIFLGSHSQNVEAFLMRLIEMKEGRQALLDFLALLPHGKSFIDYSEGFTVFIYKKDDQLQSKLVYKDKIWDLSMNDLKLMIEEKKSFNQKVEEMLSLEP
jgi:hypothetical protein